ncbi:hypothetical protein [Micromonospora radicis]|uniref:Uncharacterized protein n=1 Tax=Micromonospora radicis TaxID=1894971 RepID=A0A418MW98_9ACTN|nr:hypothetical protein [Micromonospora radicis]RIV38935.1 hypothetical protein D2L64_10955 [Micromonospora radicis]
MAESAKKVAEEAEHRLDNLAENVRRRFDRLTKGRFSDQIRAGRFGGQQGSGGDRNAGDNPGARAAQGNRGGHGAGQARTDQHRRERGGSR